MIPRSFVGNNLLQELYKRQAKPHRLTVRRLPIYHELCTAAGVTSSKFGRWLSNSAQPDLPQAAACAQVLGVPLDALCNYEPEAAPATPSL